VNGNGTVPIPVHSVRDSGIPRKLPAEAKSYENKVIWEATEEFLLVKGAVVLPKATSAEHVRRNAQLDFEISDADLASLDGLRDADKHPEAMPVCSAFRFAAEGSPDVGQLGFLELLLVDRVQARTFLRGARNANTPGEQTTRVNRHVADLEAFRLECGLVVAECLQVALT
jgi:hypothetical protein